MTLLTDLDPGLPLRRGMTFVNVIPEPSTLALAALGLLPLALVGWRRRKI